MLENGLKVPLPSLNVEGCWGRQTGHTLTPRLPSQAVVRHPESTLQTVRGYTEVTCHFWEKSQRVHLYHLSPCDPSFSLPALRCRGESWLRCSMLKPFSLLPGTVGLLPISNNTFCGLLRRICYETPGSEAPLPLSEPQGRKRSSLSWATSHVSEESKKSCNLRAVYTS